MQLKKGTLNAVFEDGLLSGLFFTTEDVLIDKPEKTFIAYNIVRRQPDGKFGANYYASHLPAGDLNRLSGSDKVFTYEPMLDWHLKLVHAQWDRGESVLDWLLRVGPDDRLDKLEVTRFVGIVSVCEAAVLDLDVKSVVTNPTKFKLNAK